MKVLAIESLNYLSESTSFFTIFGSNKWSLLSHFSLIGTELNFAKSPVFKVLCQLDVKISELLTRLALSLLSFIDIKCFLSAIKSHSTIQPVSVLLQFSFKIYLLPITVHVRCRCSCCGFVEFLVCSYST